MEVRKSGSGERKEGKTSRILNFVLNQRLSTPLSSFLSESVHPALERRLIRGDDARQAKRSRLATRQNRFRRVAFYACDVFPFRSLNLIVDRFSDLRSVVESKHKGRSISSEYLPLLSISIVPRGVQSLESRLTKMKERRRSRVIGRKGRCLSRERSMQGSKRQFDILLIRSSLKSKSSG